MVENSSSGNKSRPKNRKTRVEECATLDSFSLARPAPDGTVGGYKDWEYADARHLVARVHKKPDGWLICASLSLQGRRDTALLRTMEHIASQWPFRDAPGSEGEGAPFAAWRAGEPFEFSWATIYAPQFIAIENTTSPAGASCQWFICPGRKGKTCGRRCRMLFWRDTCFACRTCQDLAYTSQRKARIERYLRRAEKLRQQVLVRLPESDAAKWRAEPALFPPPPARMTHFRYQQLVSEWGECRSKAAVLGQMVETEAMAPEVTLSPSSCQR